MKRVKNDFKMNTKKLKIEVGFEIKFIYTFIIYIYTFFLLISKKKSTQKSPQKSAQMRKSSKKC